MKDMVLERLRAFYSTSGQHLTSTLSVLFYRDGISESMFEECHEREIKATRSAFHELKKEYKDLDSLELKLTFVVVGKRHSTRFYPKDQ